jgi:hypothetical protein
MWLLRYNFGPMFQVELKPDAHHDPLRESRKGKVGQNQEGGGFAFEVPLGNPIVDLLVSDVKLKRNQAAETLRNSIALEQMNITLRRLGVHIAHWPNNITSNAPSSIQTIGSSVFWNGTKGMNVPQQLKSLKDIAITLALNLKAQGDSDKLAYLSPVFGLFSKGEIDSWILAELPKEMVALLK